MEKPPKLSERAWLGIEHIEEFNKHHKTKIESWLEFDYLIYAEDLTYPIYENWYYKTYTKLGQALK